MNSFTEEMADLFEELRSEDEFQATLVYASGISYAQFVSPSGELYVNEDGDRYLARGIGVTIYGIKIPLSLGFTMQLSGYSRKADTSFDALRSEIRDAGLYLPVSSSNPQTVRPNVTVDGKSFIVLDVKDDNTSDPTVKLILSALQ